MKNERLIDIISGIPSLMHALFHDIEIAELDLPVNRTQRKVLIVIDRLPGVTMTQISRMSGLEKGSFTAVADKLIAMGLVKRERDPEDRRKILLRPTREGNAITHKLIQNAETHLERKLSKLDETERRELMDAFGVLSRYAEKFKK
ncbi:MAG: MarR family transcriptional regulator [Candidatus Aminicenantaceae bacterium]